MRRIIRLTKLIYQSARDCKLKSLKHKGLNVGKNFSMQKHVHIDPCAYLITIGDDVTLAPGVSILAHDASTKMHINITKLGKVTIGNKVFVGANSVILPGVTIGNNVIIGAGSIVTHDIPDGFVVAGNPAEKICSVDEFLANRQKEIKIFPNFDESYRSSQISESKKQEMIASMKDGIGYII